MLLRRLTSPGAWMGSEILSSIRTSNAVPAAPGLYRISSAEEGSRVLYVGQTGRSLRERLSALAGAYATEMPYNDPHTAAPALWALRHLTGLDYRVQWHVFEGTKQLRMGLECLAVSLERERAGESPQFNFGGMPPGYRKSSSNTARLVVAGKRFRGGPDSSVPRPPVSHPFAGPLGADPVSPRCMNLSWSSWSPLGSASPPPGSGLYRLRTPDSDRLTYVGQGRVGARLRSHAGKGAASNPLTRTAFSAGNEVSWVMLPDCPARQLLELENDLIASHVAVFDEPPLAQFLGEGTAASP